MPSQKNVLLVDDSEADRMLFDAALAKAGLQWGLTTARDAAAAIEALKAHRVDLVISDMVLGASSAEEIVTWVRTTQPNVPVVVLTGTVTDPLRQRLTELGATAVWEKPYDLERFRRALAEIDGYVRH
jgi:CheY-like chemotaxis protein